MQGSLKTSFIGSSLIAFGILACGAEGSSPDADGTDKTKNNGANTGGNAGKGGGTSLLPSAGSANENQGGMSSGSGGTPSSMAGSNAGGTPAGGSGALGACPNPPNKGVAAETLIDDLEDADNAIVKVGTRLGYWYTYADTFGSTVMPEPDPAGTGAKPTLPKMVADCHGGMYCMVVSGTNAVADEANGKYPYSGVGFDFSNAKKSCPYDVSAYTGIQMWMRGDAEVRIKVSTSQTTVHSNAHGMSQVLTPTWTLVQIPFATIMQEDWGVPAQIVPFDKSAVVNVQVQVSASGPYAFEIDDVAFY
jgi:hypothetical protein